MVVAAEVWHYWLGVPLAVGTVLAVVATIIGYFVKMSSLKYPRK